MLDAVKMPRLVVAAILVGSFLTALYSLRNYGSFGAAADLTIALLAAALCITLAAALIWANYDKYTIW